MTARFLVIVVAFVLATRAGSIGAEDPVDGEGPEPVSTQEPELSIEGVSGEVGDNVEAHLALRNESCRASRWRVEGVFDDADEQISGALRAHGYYGAKVTKTLDFTDECWNASFKIDLGEPVHIAKVDITIDGEAADDPKFLELTQALPIKEGDQLNHASYEKAKAAIASLAAERGYFEGAFNVRQLRVEPAKNEAEVRLSYDSGPRYRFGELRLSQDVLRPELAERFVSIRVDEPYSADALAAQTQGFSNSGYFNRVDVRPLIDEAEGAQVPIDMTLTARKKHSYSVGLGFGTDTGPRGKLGYENRRLNRGGHRFSARASASPVISELSADYRVPLADPRAEWLSYQAGYRHEDSESVQSDLLKLGIRQTKQRSNAWLETRFIDFLHEDYEVGDEDRTDTLLIPGISWGRTQADRTVRPRRGHRLHFEVRGSHETLGSNTSFGRMNSSLRWVRGLPWSDARFITRGDLGLTLVGDFDKLPASQRFFAGGDNSVRGYKFKDLGPKDDDGDVEGGNYLLVGSAEYEHPVSEKWSLAVFVDSGNAFDTFPDPDLKTGVGGGVRWASPVGPIRVDLATPLDDPDTAIRLHISLGADL